MFKVSRLSLCIALTALFAPVSVLAMGSSSYRIDSFAINSFGDNATSSTYGLTGSGGEEFVGLASSPNYKINAGYIAKLTNSISLTLDSLSVTIPNLVPASPAGPSQQATTQASVSTDSYGYNLNVKISQLLTLVGGSATIPNMTSPAGTIASPQPWTDNSTYGLSFTVTGTNAQAKWNSGTSYAAFPTPGTSSTIHSPSTYFISTAPDVATVHYRSAVTPAQAAGSYQNVITYSVTSKL